MTSAFGRTIWVGRKMLTLGMKPTCPREGAALRVSLAGRARAPRLPLESRHRWIEIRRVKGIAVTRSDSELMIPRLLLAARRAKEGRWGEVDALAREGWTEYIPVHDGMRNANARTLDIIHRRFGQATGDRIGTQIYDDLMTWH